MERVTDEPVTSNVRVRQNEDRSLLDLLLNSGGFGLVRSGDTHTIARVGSDYVETRSVTDILMPLDLVVLVEQPGFPAPAPVASTFLEELGRRANAEPTVVIDTSDGRVRGSLVEVARDHLSVKTWTGRILISSRAVRCVEFLGED